MIDMLVFSMLQSELAKHAVAQQVLKHFALLCRALKYVFENYNIDPWHVCCAGFSDGASVSA